MGNFLGAIAGDIIGSVYEWHNVSNYDNIELFKDGCHFTDDTVLTCAVAKWLIEDKELSNEYLAKCLKKLGKKYPGAGYGSKFLKWLHQEGIDPIGSFGNGSGMRVSPVAYFASDYDEALELAKKSAEVTHNHEEGIKGAQAITSAIYMASTGANKDEIRETIKNDFGYDVDRKWEDLVNDRHKFDATCQVTVPEAIIAFLESTDYIDAIKKAIAIGGDSDTIADMAGAIAGAYYGVPQWVQEAAFSSLTTELQNVVTNFEEFIEKKHR